MKEPIIISEGTLHPRDLIPAYIAYLDEHNYKYDLDETDLAILENEDWDNVYVPFLMDYLGECMDDAAPEGMYFGSSEGDGACIGYWPVEDDDE